MNIVKSLTLAALLLAAPAVQAAETVRLAVLAPSALVWLHAIAEDRGFYKARDLDIKVLRVGDSPALLQAVATGSVEAGVSLGDVVIRAIDQKAPVIMTGAILGKTILRLIGGAGIDQPSQLAGQKVTAGAVEGGTANLLRYQLLKLGQDPRGAQMISIPNSRDRLVAMQAKQLAGALMIAPFDTLAEREGMKVLDVYKEPYVQTPLIVNTNWAKANRPAAVKLTQAFKQAAQWIYAPENRKDAVRILAAFTATPEDVCDASYQFIVLDQQAIGRDLAISAESLQNIIKIDEAVTTSTAPRPAFDLARYYDPSFAN